MRRDRYGNFYFIDDEPDAAHDDDAAAAEHAAADRHRRAPRDPADRRLAGARRRQPAAQARDASSRSSTSRSARRPRRSRTSSSSRPRTPDKARELVHEFLRVWTRNHDPNAAAQYTNPYMFMYGFERRAESIPLTRSKQERNLVELAEWVERLRELPTGEPGRGAARQGVHHLPQQRRGLSPGGDRDGLRPDRRAQAEDAGRPGPADAREPRRPLARAGRAEGQEDQPQAARTSRPRCCAATRWPARCSTDGLKKFPDDWSLLLAQAALLHDENNYRQELAKSSEFSPKRQEALAAFQQGRRAVRRQGQGPRRGRGDDAGLRAVVLRQPGRLRPASTSTRRSCPTCASRPLIRKAILALPGEAAERHLGKFANTLFTRMSGVKPAVKFRYLKAGFEIVGDHKQAHEATQGLRLLQGPRHRDQAGGRHRRQRRRRPQQPFGVFVNLRHTREIERESGGFGRYLQNQNQRHVLRTTTAGRRRTTATSSRRPRTEALKEHFEVLSVTFQSDKVNSRAAASTAGAYTPYAYLLLKARGPQVDKLPPLRLDLDFLDTSGYVILPIESPALPLDADPAQRQRGPCRKLQITQTLDERQADKGKLILEVKATALGLVPDAGRRCSTSSRRASTSSRPTTRACRCRQFRPRRRAERRFNPSGPGW